MKKWLPYIITVIVVVVLGAMIIAANKRIPRRMDERITLREKDKNPYGMAAARALCRSLFLNASIASDDRSPGYWETLSSTGSKQAVIIVANNFNADRFELNQISNFVANGNYVFIIARTFSTDAQNFFDFSYGQNIFSQFMGVEDDSLRVSLDTPAFNVHTPFVYPGRKYESWLYSLDSTKTIVLGRAGNDANFIQFNKGEGSVFIHSAPLAFSNYFILHKNNIRYFEQALSVIPKDVERIVWNEYYLNKRSSENNKKPNWLKVLFRYPEFKWGLLTALSGLLLFIILGSRRRQRMIPPHPKPKNESLDFVRTMGRLYHDRRDHHNLAKKMAIYFLEHVRSVYKLPTHTLDEQFIDTLHFKSGFPKEHLNEIISFIHYARTNSTVNENQLTNFHKQLESFYQNT